MYYHIKVAWSNYWEENYSKTCEERLTTKCAENVTKIS